MDYSKKAAEPKKQKHVVTNQGGSSRHNAQTGNQPLYSSHSSRRPGVEESSQTRVVRPPVSRPPNLKEHTRTTNSSSQSKSSNSTKRQETVEQKKDRLLSELNKFDSPFTWRPRQVKPVSEPETIINRMRDKDREVIDERKFKFRNFIFHLVIAYELWRDSKLTLAFEEVCNLESQLHNQTNRGEFLFISIEDALWHVVSASKAFLCYEQEDMAQAEDMIGKIKPVKTMSRQNKGGIHGIKAAMFLEYGHQGNVNALEEARLAVGLDRSTAEWHFLIGKCLGRIRRVAQCHELVHPEESLAFNRAIRLDERNATYKVFLAQVLSESAFREYKKNYPDPKSEHYKKLRKINWAACHLFREAEALSPNSSHILMRCARGQMRLPPLMKDLIFSKNCIERALKIAPNNPMAHHIQAMYHERYDCDTELLLQAYEKAASLGNFGAAMDLIRLHHRLKIGDIIKELEILASEYEQVDKRQVIYAQAGSYLLFIKKDIIGALKYYFKVIEIDPKSYAMKSHKPIFFRLRDPVNMFDVLLEELATKTDWRSFTPEENRLLRNFRIKISEHQQPPNEMKKRPTVEAILELSRNVVESDNMYKDKMSRRRKRTFTYKQKKQGKKVWHGNKKAKLEPKKVNISGIQELRPEVEMGKNDRKDINTPVETMRRDSFSSVDSVDSDYHRDSTTFGPRSSFLSGGNEMLGSKNGERFDSHLNPQVRRCFGNSARPSRDPSISSTSSGCSSVDFGSGQDQMYPHVNTSAKSQLTVENLKKLDIENSYDTGILRLSKLSLSNSSVSLASSSNTLSVMDRVRQSYAMLGRTSDSTQGKKKPFNKSGSTQSLNTDYKGTKNITERLNTLCLDPTKGKKTPFKKSGSTQSLNTDYKGSKNITEGISTLCLNETGGNEDSKFTSSYKSRFSSCDSSVERRSSCFMPSFASKNSGNDLEQ